MWSWGPALIGRTTALIWWRLAEARRHRKWQYGSHSPTPMRKTLIGWHLCVCVCDSVLTYLLKTYATELLCCLHLLLHVGVFSCTLLVLKLWPLTLWQPQGLCLSDLTCPDWTNDQLTVHFLNLNSREPFLILAGPEFWDVLVGCWLLSRPVWNVFSIFSGNHS